MTSKSYILDGLSNTKLQCFSEMHKLFSKFLIMISHYIATIQYNSNFNVITRKIKMEINIAVILTCFNRKNKTIACLTHLFEACKSYNSLKNESPIILSIYLTDDGCTDGTPDAVKICCKSYDLHIIQGDGHCYWAGGMRLAWKEALKKKDKWDFYLLLNDDTMVFENVFEELLYTNMYAVKNFGNVGIYSGITCDISDKQRVTYGGEKFHKGNFTDNQKVNTKNHPQIVDLTNANILLVPKEIVERFGIFDDGFVHGGADYDYSLRIGRKGFPVLVTSKICGECEYDHLSGGEEIEKIKSMSLAERKKYFKNPTHFDKDYLYYIKRNFPQKFIPCWILRKIRIYQPTLYKIICLKRGLVDFK